MRGLVNYICKPLVALGALNWGALGLFGFDLVYYLVGATVLGAAIYTIIGVAALIWILWSIFARAN